MIRQNIKSWYLASVMILRLTSCGRKRGPQPTISAVEIKRAWQINFARERINFTRNEIELMKDWELNVNWEKSLIVDKTINFYGQKQQSRLEKNLAAFKKQGKKGND